MRLVSVASLVACSNQLSLDDERPVALDDDALVVVDRALESGYLDNDGGHFRRGRSTSAIDVDSDGDVDIVSGNPGDETYLIVNDTEPGGPLRFHRGQAVDPEGLCYWAIGAGDLDNDGDPDLFAGVGGNESKGFDAVYRNDGTPGQEFVDVTEQANVMIYDKHGDDMMHSTAGTLLMDFDNDGLLDVFLSIKTNTASVGTLEPKDVKALNPMWHNEGNMRFEDVGPAIGLLTQNSTRHSTFLDIENDGDLDLWENNWDGGGVLWRNLLAETGMARYEDVTQEFSLGHCDMKYPLWSSTGSMFASAATDLNNDGFDDLIVWRRGPPGGPQEPDGQSPGHLLWLNVAGTGFVEVANYTDINDTFVWRDHDAGVMGSQTGDWNADGFPDLFMGHGSPTRGESSRLYLSSGLLDVEIDGVGMVAVPQFRDFSALIDFPSDLGEGWTGIVPVYPYRTHGSVAADFDGDGDLELAQHNGGVMDTRVGTDEEMQEPDRMWDFVFPDPQPHWLQVDLVGDGINVNTDGVGTKVHLQAEQSDGSLLDLYQVRRTQSGFSAYNQPGVHFGLAQAVSIASLVVTWPDGMVQEVLHPALDTRITVTR